MTELWRAYQPQVLRILRAKRTPDADDVASRVWLDVGRSLDRFGGDGTDFRRWVFTIASRRSVDAFRTATRLDALALEMCADATVVPGADVVFDEQGAVDRALAIVGQLPPATAEAVMLRVVYDMSVSDVARIMEREDATVRVLVHRGLRRLRELLGEPADEAENSGDECADVTLDGSATLI